MELGRILNPKNFPIFGLLGRKGLGPEVFLGQEPATMEGVEDVKYRKIRVPSNCIFLHRLSHRRGSGRGGVPARSVADGNSEVGGRAIWVFHHLVEATTLGGWGNGCPHENQCVGKFRGIRGANLTLQLGLLGGAIEGLGGSESTSISAACVTRFARAACTEAVLEGRKEGGVEDIDENDGGGKKQKAPVTFILNKRLHWGTFCQVIEMPSVSENLQVLNEREAFSL
jgi:hypothetical protein